MAELKSRYVGNAPFFSTLTEEEQTRISERMHLEHRRSGETLFHQDADSTALYLIKSGWVRLVTDGGTAIASQGPGSLVGETDLFLDRPRTHGATFATDAEVWVLDKADVVELIAASPQLGLKLTLAFGGRLALFDQYLVDNQLTSLPFLSRTGRRDAAGGCRAIGSGGKVQRRGCRPGGTRPGGAFPHRIGPAALAQL